MAEGLLALPLGTIRCSPIVPTAQTNIGRFSAPLSSSSIVVYYGLAATNHRREYHGLLLVLDLLSLPFYQTSRNVDCCIINFFGALSRAESMQLAICLFTSPVASLMSISNAVKKPDSSAVVFSHRYRKWNIILKGRNCIDSLRS